MSELTDYLVPLIIGGILLFALVRKTELFSAFLRGAAEGLKTTVGILPSLVALLIAVYMLRASGAIDLVAAVLAPVLAPLGIPEQVAPLMLLKPFSGGGSLALGTEIIRQAGVDSYAGRVAAVMLGSCETTFYVIAVYFGAVGVTKTRYTLTAALTADITAFLLSALTVRLLMSSV